VGDTSDCGCRGEIVGLEAHFTLETNCYSQNGDPVKGGLLCSWTRLRRNVGGNPEITDTHPTDETHWMG
jgi:hypothetical protein